MRQSYAIGIDLGATNIKLAAVTRAGEILDDQHHSSDDWKRCIKNSIAKIEAARGVADHIGVAAPGLASPDNRTITWMMGRLDNVMNFDWGDHLDRRVAVINDAHAALLAERWLGAAQSSNNVVMLTLGTGVGGAILCDGRLLRGHIGRAGHFGHITVNASGEKDIVNTPGSLEDAIGECTLPRRSDGRFSTTKQLLDAIRAGDGDAGRIWLSSIHALAAGIASIVNAVDPELIILGGGIAQAGEQLFRPLEQALDQMEWRPNGHRVRIVPAALGDRAGALGAAWFAMNRESI